LACAGNSGNVGDYPYYKELGALVDDPQSAEIVGFVTAARYEAQNAKLDQALRMYEAASQIEYLERVDYYFWGEYAHVACMAGKAQLCRELLAAFGSAVEFVSGRRTCRDPTLDMKNQLISRLCQESVDNWVFGEKPDGFSNFLQQMRTQLAYLKGDAKPR
jgi:hypothetical protein